MFKSLKHIGAAALIVALLGFGATTAQAHHRHVVINNHHVTGAQLQDLDWRSGGRIPDGRYWLNHRTGEWGYAGDPWPRGRIAPARRYSGIGSAKHQEHIYWSDAHRRKGNRNCFYLAGIPLGKC